MRPSCSVLLPVYNGKKTIGKAIASALEQGSALTELVIVDNQSDDGTWEYLQTFQDPRIRLFRNPRNLGLFGNFNSCLEKARSDVLVFLCADDRFYPQVLDACLQHFDIHSRLALVNAKGWAVNESGERVKGLAEFLPPGLYAGESAKKSLLLFHSKTGHNPFNYPGGVFMRRALVQDLRFDTSQRRCGDIDFFYRALERGDLACEATRVCEITFHAAQEGRSRREETIELQEFESMIEKLKLDPHLRHRLLVNFRALSLWRGSLFLFKGMTQGFANHWRHAFAKKEYLRVSLSFVLFIGRRLLALFVKPLIVDRERNVHQAH